MATLIVGCGFECGLISGPHISAVNNASFDTTTVRNGLRSLRLNPSSSQGICQFQTLGSNVAVNVAKFYIRFATLPTADNTVAYFLGTNPFPGVVFKQSDSKLYAGSKPSGISTGASGVSVTTGQWYAVDVKVDTSSNPWLIDVTVDGASCGQASVSAAATNGRWDLSLGSNDASVTWDYYIDDVIGSQTGGDYPLGGTDSVFVKSYIPSGDGTHNVASTNDFERSATGTDIDNTTTDSYLLINSRPLSASDTDYILVLNPPNATDYVENTYEDSAEAVAPIGVTFMAGVGSASAGGSSNNLRIALRDSNGGTQADAINIDPKGLGYDDGAIHWVSNFFSAIPGGGAWTDTAFDALVTRIYSSDAAPDALVYAIMLEAVFQQSTGTSASISGEVATASASALAPTITAVRTVSVSGEVSVATSDSLAGSVQIARSVSGEVSTATADSLAPTITSVQATSIAAEAATASAAAPTGAIQIARSIAGEVSTATADALAGTFQSSISISAEVAQADADALAGSIATISTASISGEVAAATATANTSTVTALITTSVSGEVAAADADAKTGSVQIARSISAETSTATADSLTPTITAVRTVSVTGEVATATSDSLTGTVTALISATVSAEAANADAVAGTGTVTTIEIKSIAGEVAQANASALTGTVTAQIQVQVTGEVATATSDGLAPTITAVRIVEIAGVVSTATSDTLAGTIQIARSISAETATTDADALAGVITAVPSGGVSVAGEAATATASAYAATVTAQLVVTISAEVATATADANGAVIFIHKKRVDDMIPDPRSIAYKMGWPLENLGF